jgi:hypothetical protein
MIDRLVRGIVRAAAPLAALGLGAALSGCAFMGGWDEVEGVPLAELDMSGAAPSRIVMAGPDKIVISEGDGLAISLEGNREAGDALRFDREDNRLTIARDNSVYDGSGSAIVRITMPAPEELGIAGSGTIEAVTMASNASIEIAGSGAITVERIESDSLEVEIAGSGDVGASGSTRTLSIEIAGSGDVRFAELNADDVTVEIAGSGDVELASDGTVSAEIAGSGDIVVMGNATCSVSSAGSGSLTCRPRQASAQAGSQAAAPEAEAEGADAE